MTVVSGQIAVVPLGHLMAVTVTLNQGPFNAAEVGVHAEPGAVQRKGERADHHDLHQLWSWQRLRHPHRQRRQAVLQEEPHLLSGAAGSCHYPGVGLQLGRPLPEVLGRALCHVVAAEPCPSLSFQVRF